MKKFLGALVIFGTVGLAGGDTFDLWDRNGDQKLTREEVPPRLRGNFDRVDRDGSGWISRSEHEAVVGRAKPATGVRGGQAGRAGRIPDGYQLIADIPYAGTENPAQKLDLYLPEAKSGAPRGLIVFIHGGAWRSGTKAGGGERCHRIDPEGKYAYASVDYRLTGEAIWPAQIHDCKAAIRWLRGNAEKYGIDPEKIAVYGTSAGGHLVAMLGVSGGVEELEGELGEFDDESSRVACVVNYFGPSNLVSMAEQPSTMDHRKASSPEGLLIGGAIPENLEKAKAASPVTYVTKDDVPTLTAHGTKDPVVPFAQGEELEAALEKAGVVSVFIPMSGAGHGFQSADLDKRVEQFLDRYLGGNEKAGDISEAAIEVATK